MLSRFRDPYSVYYLLRIQANTLFYLLTYYKETNNVQWNLSIGTPLFKGHLHSGDKIWSWKNAHIIFVFITSFEGTALLRGKGHFFWVPNLNTLELEK